MEVEYDHFDRPNKDIANVSDLYATVSKQPKDEVYSEALAWGKGHVVDSNSSDDKGKGKSNNEEKSKKMKVIYIIITTIFALAGLCIGVVALTKMSTITSEMEIQKLIGRSNELEALVKSYTNGSNELTVMVESCNARASELENTSAELNSSFQVLDGAFSQMQNKIRELEQTVIQLHGLFVLNGYGYVVSKETKSWSKIRKICQMQGGDLAAIGIRNSTSRRTIGEALLQESETVWIGLNDLDNENEFVWADGVNARMENTPWRENEPNGKSGENCVDIDGHNPYGLIDRRCSIKKPGLCEISL